MYGRLLQLKVYKRLIINDAYVKYKISNSTSIFNKKLQIDSFFIKYQIM